VVVAKKWYMDVYAAAVTSTLFYSLIWSGVFVSLMLNVLLIGARALYLIELNEPKIYIKFTGYTMIMFLTQVAAAIAVDVKCKDFPIPLVVHYSFLGCVFPNWSNIIVQSLVIWNIFVFIQQIAFHSFFLIISLHTQPIGVASMLVIYTIFLFSLVSLLALFMELAQVVKRLVFKQEIKKMMKNIKRLVSAVTAGIILMCLMIIWTAFMLISNGLSLDTTRLTHPVVASLLISVLCWTGNNMLCTYWTEHASHQHTNHDTETEMATINASLTAPLIDNESETNN